jgi:hypothetical protein
LDSSIWSFTASWNAGGEDEVALPRPLLHKRCKGSQEGEDMRNRRRNWFLRRLALGFAIALVVVPAAQAYPDEGTKVQKTFVQFVDDFPRSSQLAPEVGGAAVRGEVKDGLGTSPGSVVIVGDDKRGLPSVSVVPVGHRDNWRGATPSQAAMRIVRPQDLPARQAAILAELDAKTNEYVAGAAPVVDEPVQVVSNPSNGFDWGDAGIGAGTVFAVLLLGAGALLATRHAGHPAQV